jgi:uncharacterized phiE125 gp8 family phage protein
MGLRRTVEPVKHAVDCGEAKKQCEIASDDEAHDSHFHRLIAAATADVERHTRRALITQTWKLSLREFPFNGRIELPRPPLQSITSIQYVSTSGTLTTLASSEYQVSVEASPGYVEPAYSKSWPSVRSETADAIQITYVAGFGSGYASVPQQYQNAIYELVAFRFGNRGDVDTAIPKHIMWALQSLRCGAFGEYYGIK